MITIDANDGIAAVVNSDDDPLDRPEQNYNLDHNHVGLGRELFAAFRARVSGAEEGASSLGGVT